MTPAQSFGLVLRELRNERGLSQEQLGLASGLDRTFISQLERGIKQPSLTTLISLSGQLGIDAPTLLKLTMDRLDENNTAHHFI
jgi:transcriptional regulator with XRE-family HTH domain